MCKPNTKLTPVEMLSVLQSDVTVRRSNSQSIRCRRRGNKTQMAPDFVNGTIILTKIKNKGIQYLSAKPMMQIL